MFIVLNPAAYQRNPGSDDGDDRGREPVREGEDGVDDGQRGVAAAGEAFDVALGPVVASRV